MLVSFSVSNFRSFDEEQTFSLVASKRHGGEHPNHTLQIGDSDEQVLRAAVIYGANGAGKSNLFKALRFLRGIAIHSRQKEEPLNREPFLLRAHPRPTSMDLHFLSMGVLFRYWVRVDDVTILEESLSRIDRGKDRTIYERSTSPEGKVEVKLRDIGTPAPDTRARLEALATVGGPHNQSFLATVFTTLDLWPDLFACPITWFLSQLRLIGPEQPDPSFRQLFADDPGMLKFASEFLNAASTGIDHLAATKNQISEEDVSRLFGLRIGQRLSAAMEEKPVRVQVGNGDIVVATRIGDELQYTMVEIKAAHLDAKGQSVPFDIRQESDGTQRLLQLIHPLHAMHHRPMCYFVDEIDRSLHPMLVHDYLGFFLRSCKGEEAQLIMTTHESNLLDQDLLRRDEIWFAEKNRQGATVLYSLLDFHPRNDMQLRKNYLQGRFGAVPFLGGIERLLEEEKKTP